MFHIFLYIFIQLLLTHFQLYFSPASSHVEFGAFINYFVVRIVESKISHLCFPPDFCIFFFYLFHKFLYIFIQLLLTHFQLYFSPASSHVEFGTFINYFVVRIVESKISHYVSLQIFVYSFFTCLLLQLSCIIPVRHLKRIEFCELRIIFQWYRFLQSNSLSTPNTRTTLMAIIFRNQSGH
ncbi:hypothetical protein MSWH1_1232 [Methanosarcina sp. WH1]|nr:hypothetical protein MSWH1_1232 [Methanosarcina sp. WH1]